MGRNIQDGTNVDPATVEFPDGRIRDKAGIITGTTGNEALFGDMTQFFAKLMRDASITTNGNPDNETNGYQLMQGLVAKIIASIGFNFSVVEIGDWNMDFNESVSFAHGLTYAKIIGAEAIIRNNADNERINLCGLRDIPTTNTGEGGQIIVGSTNVTLYRRVDGEFDTPDFNSTSYNRGWVIIKYLT